MKRSRYLLLVALVVFLQSQHTVLAQAPGSKATYPVGWNLIAAPPGTDVSKLDSLFTLQPGDARYRTLAPSQGTVPGQGYWAYLAPPIVTTLAGGRVFSAQSMSGLVTFGLGSGSPRPYTIAAPPGQPVMIGNPSGVASATISGVTAAYTYDPLKGYQPAITLTPGQGAWALADAGGTITVTPGASASSPPASALAPQSLLASAPAAGLPPPPPPLPPSSLVTAPPPPNTSGTAFSPNANGAVTILPPPDTSGVASVTGSAVVGQQVVQAPPTAGFVPQTPAVVSVPQTTAAPRLPNTGTGGLLSTAAGDTTSVRPTGAE